MVPRGEPESRHKGTQRAQDLDLGSDGVLLQAGTRHARTRRARRHADTLEHPREGLRECGRGRGMSSACVDRKQQLGKHS